MLLAATPADLIDQITSLARDNRGWLIAAVVAYAAWTNRDKLAPLIAKLRGKGNVTLTVETDPGLRLFQALRSVRKCAAACGVPDTVIDSTIKSFGAYALSPVKPFAPDDGGDA